MRPRPYRRTRFGAFLGQTNRARRGYLRNRPAEHELRVQRAIAEPLVEREHADEPLLVRGAKRGDAVRLRPANLRALDRACDAASASRAGDCEEAVPPSSLLEVEEAVADRAAAFERDEVRVGGVRIAPPRAPVLEALDPLLRPSRLVAVRLTCDLEQRMHEV